MNRRGQWRREPNVCEWPGGTGLWAEIRENSAGQSEDRGRSGKALPHRDFPLPKDRARLFGETVGHQRSLYLEVSTGLWDSLHCFSGHCKQLRVAQSLR